MTTLEDCIGMVKRLNNTIVRYFAASDIRYSIEQTEKKLYSLNVIDISFKSIPDKTERVKPFGQTKGILKTLTMNTLENIYFVLYSMCNTLDNLTYSNGSYEVLKY